MKKELTQKGTVSEEPKRLPYGLYEVQVVHEGEPSPFSKVTTAKALTSGDTAAAAASIITTAALSSSSFSLPQFAATLTQPSKNVLKRLQYIHALKWENRVGVYVSTNNDTTLHMYGLKLIRDDGKGEDETILSRQDTDVVASHHDSETMREKKLVLIHERSYKKLVSPCKASTSFHIICHQFVPSWEVFFSIVSGVLTMFHILVPSSSSSKSLNISDSMVELEMENATPLSSTLSTDKQSHFVDSKSCVMDFFSVQESKRLVCSYSSQTNCVYVYDFIPARRACPLRSIYSMSDCVHAANVVENLVCMSEHILFISFSNKGGKFMDLQSGQTIPVILRHGSSTDFYTSPRKECLLHHALLPSATSMDSIYLVFKSSGVLLVYNTDQNGFAEVDELRIEWENGVPPIQLLLQFPFLITVFLDRVEIRHCQSMRLHQTIAIKSVNRACLPGSLPRSTYVHFNPPHDVLPSFTGVLVASQNAKVHWLSMTSISKCVQNYILDEKYVHALDLCVSCPKECGQSVEAIERLHAQEGLQKFKEEKFMEATTHFLQSRVDARHVFALYPSEIFPRNVALLFDSSSSKHLKDLFTQKGMHAILSPHVLPKALNALVHYIRHRRKDSSVDDFLKSGQKELPYDAILLKLYVVLGDDTSMVRLMKKPESSIKVGEMEMFLRSHKKWIALYHAYAIRNLHRKVLDLLEELEEIARVDVDRPDIQVVCTEDAFFRASMTALNCTPTEVFRWHIVQYLQQLGLEHAALVCEFSKRLLKYHPLQGLRVFIYRNIKGSSEVQHENNNSNNNSNSNNNNNNQNGDKGDDESQDGFPLFLVLNHLKDCTIDASAVVLSSSSLTSSRPGLDIPKPSRLEKAREDCDLVVETEAASRLAPLLGPNDGARNTFLNSLEAKATEEFFELRNGRDLAMEYLWFVICIKESKLAEAHDELVYLLLDAISSEAKKEATNESSSIHVGTLVGRPSNQAGYLGTLRRKLLMFLKGSTRYHPERMLSRIRLDMVEERSICLSKLGRHEEVLKLYLNELQDASLAEAYCHECYENSVNVYLNLLCLYLHLLTTEKKVEDNSSVQPKIFNKNDLSMSTVLHFLATYAERFNAVEVLDILPPSLCLNAPFFAYVNRVLERQRIQYNQSKVLKSLYKVNNLQKRLQLIRLQSQSVQVTLETKCYVCKHVIGSQTFCFYPLHGRLVHYTCSNKLTTALES